MAFRDRTVLKLSLFFYKHPFSSMNLLFLFAEAICWIDLG
ncbi:hypothetical protein HMPREF0972_00715 [Actinomyces sp. oral taxon 848 str. F0332]|nr:hypothetical protein HMPREF0972_00715 [Actinomyces sp. oral taxon 848 str. F0332]